MATSKPQTIIIQPGKRITAREYAALPDEPGWKTELYRGVVVKMPLIRDLRHEHIASNLHGYLWSYVTPRHLGRCTLEQGGFDATLPGEPDETTRGPDITFSTNERLVLQEAAIARGDYATPPDLVAEIVSASQSRADMVERSERWLAAGSRLVWNVWPDSETVDVWTPDTPMQTIGPGGVLDGQDVIPGFTLALDDLFA